MRSSRCLVHSPCARRSGAVLRTHWNSTLSSNSIKKQVIDRPVFVLGWPRTGTTLLQRLLCLHRDALYLPVWEAYNILTEERGRPITLASRRGSAKRALSMLHWIAPDLGTIHPLGLDDPDECYHLLRNYF